MLVDQLGLKKIVLIIHRHVSLVLAGIDLNFCPRQTGRKDRPVMLDASGMGAVYRLDVIDRICIRISRPTGPIGDDKLTRRQLRRQIIFDATRRLA